jgi:hypothetical protein
MSFSVSAQSFVPASLQRPTSPSSEWTVAAGAGEMPVTGAAVAGAQHAGGMRRVVCSTFFQHGACSDGDFCAFAHHADELDMEARAHLFAVMGDSLPLHFVDNRNGMTKTPPDHLPPSQTPPGSASRVYSAANRRTVTTSWRGPQDDCPPQLSLTDEPIRVHLPARCRYPHAVSGTYYDYLNVKQGATQAVIEEAYRHWRSSGYRAAKSVDAVKADAIDRLVVDAKNVLGNPTMRAEYDAQLPPAITTPLATPKKVAPSSNAASVAPPLSATMFEDIWR